MQRPRYHIAMDEETHALLCAYRRKCVDGAGGAHVSLAAALRNALTVALEKA